MPKLEPAPADFADTAPHRLATTAVIDATASELWAVIDDTATWTEWFPGMSSCEPTSDPSQGLGATRTVKIDRLVAEERFVVYEPERAWAFTVLRTNIPLARQLLEGFELEPVEHSQGARTKVTYRAGLRPHPLTRPLLGRVTETMEQSWAGAIAGLGDFVAR